VYEELTADFPGVMQRIGREVGVPPFEVRPPRLRRQANDRTETLVQQAMRLLQGTATTL
jgi:LPS sulfotransferase NodH